MPGLVPLRRADSAGAYSLIASAALAATLAATGVALLATPCRAVDDDESDAPEGVEAPQSEDTAAESEPLPVGPVAVTATRVEQEVLDLPGHISVIDREEIERSGARDVPELLRREPGLFITNTTTNAGGYTVEARGFNDGGGNGSSLLVLVDGRRINEPDSSTPDWSVPRLDHIERIEIVRGPASAVWGDNAVSGVVHIITRQGEGPLEATLTGHTGSYGDDGGSFYGGGTLGPVSASFFAEGYSTNGYRDRAGFRTWQYEGSLRGTLGEAAVLGVRAGYTTDKREFPGALSMEEIELLGRRAAAPGTEDDRLDRHRWHLDGDVAWSLGEGALLKLTPFYHERSDRTLTTAPATALSSGFRNQDDADTYSVGVNSLLEIERRVLGVPNRLVLGADFLRDRVDSENAFDLFDADGTVLFSGTGDTRTRRWDYGGFVQNEIGLTETISASGGVRFDYARMRGRDRANDTTFRIKKTIWSPKAALTWRFAEPASVYASYARGFRMPNINEAFGFFGFNPGLDPQKTDSFEIGAKLRSERIRADLAAYWMIVHDQIYFDHEIDDPDFGFPAPRDVNLDKVWHRGVELFVSAYPWEWIELHGSYTYTDTEIRKDDITDLEGKELPITPHHRGRLGFRLELPWWLELGMDVNIVGSRWLANDLRNEWEKLPKFATWDLRAAFHPKLREWLELDASVEVRNLFERDYTGFGGERTFSRGAFGFNPSPRRNYTARLAIRVTQ